MHITGEHDRSPVKVGVAMTDLVTGIYAHGAVMAALIYRYRTGLGQHIDACLSDSQLATLANVGSSELISDFTTQSTRWGTAHPSIVPYRSFESRDGSYILLGGANDRFFGIICDQFGKPEWKVDPRFV